MNIISMDEYIKYTNSPHVWKEIRSHIIGYIATLYYII